MFDAFKQLKQLREQAHKIDELLRDVVITQSSKDNRITLRMNGKQEILSLDISPEAQQSVDLAEDIKNLFNTAVTESQKSGATAMRNSGQLPGV